MMLLGCRRLMDVETLNHYTVFCFLGSLTTLNELLKFIVIVESSEAFKMNFFQCAYEKIYVIFMLRINIKLYKSENKSLHTFPIFEQNIKQNLEIQSLITIF